MRKALFFLFLSSVPACGGTAAVPNDGDAAAPVVGAPDGGACPSDHSTCNGVCTDTSTNQDNCGACGHACAPMERCERGACTFLGCNPELVVCDGICRLLSKADTCGSCATKCGAGEVCSLQQCGDACAAGYTACNGACADLSHDPYNCGECGKTCDLSCVAGHCTSECPAGWHACVAGCRDVTSDPLHCGICGNTCAPGEVCAKGHCAPPAR